MVRRLWLFFEMLEASFMLITPARAQPFGGPTYSGGDSAFAPPPPYDVIVEIVAWGLLIAIMVAFAWPFLKWMLRGGRR